MQTNVGQRTSVYRESRKERCAVPLPPGAGKQNCDLAPASKYIFSKIDNGRFRHDVLE